MNFSLAVEEAQAAAPSDLWLAAMISAVVSIGFATIVTLVIEWFAKPKLEAKKERIMASYRAKQEIKAAASREFRNVQNKDSGSGIPTQHREAYERFIQAIGDKRPYIYSESDNAAITIALEMFAWLTLTRSYTGERGEAVKLMNSAIDIGFIPAWRRRKRRQAIQEIHQKIQALSDRIFGPGGHQIILHPVNQDNQAEERQDPGPTQASSKTAEGQSSHDQQEGP